MLFFLLPSKSFQGDGSQWAYENFVIKVFIDFLDAQLHIKESPVNFTEELQAEKVLFLNGI